MKNYNFDKFEDVVEFFFDYKEMTATYDKVRTMPSVQKMFSKEVVTARGTVQYGTVRTEYDYKISNHPEYTAILEALDELTIRKKAIEEELRNMYKVWESHNDVTKPRPRVRNIFIETVPALRYDESGEVAYVNIPDCIKTSGIIVKSKPLK